MFCKKKIAQAVEIESLEWETAIIWKLEHIRDFIEEGNINQASFVLNKYLDHAKSLKT